MVFCFTFSNSRVLHPVKIKTGNRKHRLREILYKTFSRIAFSDYLLQPCSLLRESVAACSVCSSNKRLKHTTYLCVCVCVYKQTQTHTDDTWYHMLMAATWLFPNRLVHTALQWKLLSTSSIVSISGKDKSDVCAVSSSAKLTQTGLCRMLLLRQ